VRRARRRRREPAPRPAIPGSPWVAAVRGPSRRPVCCSRSTQGRASISRRPPWRPREAACRSRRGARIRRRRARQGCASLGSVHTQRAGSRRKVRRAATTRLLVAALPPGQTPIHDDREAVDSSGAPHDALARFARARAAMLPPTVGMLPSGRLLARGGRRNAAAAPRTGGSAGADHRRRRHLARDAATTRTTGTAPAQEMRVGAFARRAASRRGPARWSKEEDGCRRKDRDRDGRGAPHRTGGCSP
jgi:hypothetical protein